METRTSNQNLRNDRFYQEATQNRDIEGLQLALARNGLPHTERDSEDFCESVAIRSKRSAMTGVAR